MTTWLFEPESFAPLAKQVNGKTFGIITDHLGTPLSMHDIEGSTVWSAELNCYGQVENLVGKAKDCPFRYPGQYEDVETGLYYNRFRYYSPEEGMYISQDPIGLEGGDNLYGYVEDANIFVDVHGLQPIYILDCATARERVIAENGIPKGDITVINGYVKAELVDPNSNIWPQGKSATNDMFCGLTGQLYQIND